jgi:hypothetical protein
VGVAVPSDLTSASLVSSSPSLCILDIEPLMFLPLELFLILLRYSDSLRDDPPLNP